MATPGTVTIAELISRLAADLPTEVTQVVAEILVGADTLITARQRIMKHVSNAEYRSRASQLLDRCQSDGLQPSSAGLALQASGISEKENRRKQQVEIVWTGPDADAVPFRRTEQVLLQVLDSAKDRITLVSYAVYAIPHIREALVRAAKRGVKINVILETPDKTSGENAYSTLKALGQEVAACSTVYFWPEESRPKDGHKTAILHVKCLAADGRWLFVSSANLTEYAFTINMELGVLITGGKLPRQVESHFDWLIGEKELVRT